MARLVGTKLQEKKWGGNAGKCSYATGGPNDKHDSGFGRFSCVKKKGTGKKGSCTSTAEGAAKQIRGGKGEIGREKKREKKKPIFPGEDYKRKKKGATTRADLNKQAKIMWVKRRIGVEIHTQRLFRKEEIVK